MAFDEKVITKYLKDSSKCPYCGAAFQGDVVWEQDEWVHENDNCYVKVHYRCYSCDKKYCEVYRLLEIISDEPETEG